jgi:hypothetical protein
MPSKWNGACVLPTFGDPDLKTQKKAHMPLQSAKKIHMTPKP